LLFFVAIEAQAAALVVAGNYDECLAVGFGETGALWLRLHRNQASRILARAASLACSAQSIWLPSTMRKKAALGCVFANIHKPCRCGFRQVPSSGEGHSVRFPVCSKQHKGRGAIHGQSGQIQVPD
jgi:hypothetical protein